MRFLLSSLSLFNSAYKGVNSFTITPDVAVHDMGRMISGAPVIKMTAQYDPWGFQSWDGGEELRQVSTLASLDGILPPAVLSPPSSSSALPSLRPSLPVPFTFPSPSQSQSLDAKAKQCNAMLTSWRLA